MSRALDPIEAAWVESFEESASELLKRGEFKLARVAGALADAIRKGEPIDLDTFRRAEKAPVN